MYWLLFYGWQDQQTEKFELLKSAAILTGSFSNPDAAREMLKKDTAQFSSSEEDFETSLQMVENSLKSQRRRKRKIIDKGLNGGT